MECSEDTDINAQIKAAIKEMNKLDTILEQQRFKEKVVKKQGREMRAMLWEELQVRSFLLILCLMCLRVLSYRIIVFHRSLMIK